METIHEGPPKMFSAIALPADGSSRPIPSAWIEVEAYTHAGAAGQCARSAWAAAPDERMMVLTRAEGDDAFATWTAEAKPSLPNVVHLSAHWPMERGAAWDIGCCNA